MAIVLPSGRPAIDIVNGKYGDPDPLWAHLGSSEMRRRLETAIAAVGRVDFIGEDLFHFGGTGFVVGPNLVLTKSLGLILNERAFKAGKSAIIDFGHERAGGVSPRVLIEEVIYIDPIWNVELVRASIPDSIRPLALSVTEPDDLYGRDAVLIGYPSFDPRSEASLMQQIFGGVFEVKRMLPGKLRGAGFENEKPVLFHDCSSAGGTSGAPLIDVVNGAVVGIQVGGLFLERNFAFSAANLSTDPAFAERGVQFVGPAKRRSPMKNASRDVVVDEVERRSRVLDIDANLGFKPATPSMPEASTPGVLEAIIVASSRPSWPAKSWAGMLGELWQPTLTPFKDRIDLALRSVGLLITDVDRDAWNASAFLVGDRLAVTASFATLDFVDGSGTRAVMKPGRKAAIDFSDALGLDRRSAMATVSGVKFIHPAFYIALLELENVPEGTYILNMAAQLPSELAGRSIAVLSYGAHADPDRSAADLLVQPGHAQQVGQIPGVPGLPGLIHDCMTAAGAAGGPVLDIGTGYAVGVHTHSAPYGGGFAQPTWELARDPYVWNYPIGFRPDPRPSWLSAWETGASKQDPVAIGLPPMQRWTVDDVPIDWTKDEPKQMENILNAIEAQWALYSAENAGLPLGSVNSAAPPKILWREIIKRASMAGVLRRLIEELVNDNPGIAPKLRPYL